MFPLKFKKFTGTAKEFARAHGDDVGYDMYSDLDACVLPGKMTAIPTGIGLELPVGLAGMIFPRSGLAWKHGITVLNSPGLIDPGYRGEIVVMLQNHGKDKFHVNRGDRIAQMVFMCYADVDFYEEDDLSDSLRGGRGLGSTGV